MRALQLFLAFSVVASIALCKPALAEQTSDSADGFKLRGYSSAGVDLHPGGKADGSLNEVSLMLSWEGESRFRFFSELELQHPLVWKSGEGFSKQNSYIDLQRLYLDYNLSDKLNIRAGHFLTPAGRWNLIHAAPLVWTSTRPLATSRLFPLFLNGAMFYGATTVNDEAFEYSMFAETLKDQDHDEYEIEFNHTRGMRFVMTGKTSYGLTLMEFTETEGLNRQFQMLGLDFMTQRGGWEFSGEAFQRYYTSGGDGGNGGYLQAVAPLGNNWYGIGRLESYKRPAEGSSERWLLGTAWRYAPNRIIKMEYVGGDEERPESPKGFLASFAILF